MEITLTPDLELELAAAVESGRFGSTSEAVSEGLRRLFADLHAEATMPDWLRIGASRDDDIPAAVEAALDRATEDIRTARTVPASEVLAEIDTRIAAYFARRGAGIGR